LDDDAGEQARRARWAMLLPHRELAMGMVVRATGSLSEAEDCVHDAMLRLVRRQDLDPRRVRSLLVRASLHIAIDHRRSAAREQSAVVRLGGGVEAEAVSPDQVLARRTEAARVLAAVDSLPRRERQVMLLRLAGLSVAEAAGHLGISVKSVEGAYTRARARIRNLLGGAFGWLADRVRRVASPHAEMAVVTATALLLAVPGWWSEQPPHPSTTAIPHFDGISRHDAEQVAMVPPPPWSHPGFANQGDHPRPTPPPNPSHHDEPWQPRHITPQPLQVGTPIQDPFGIVSTAITITWWPDDPRDEPRAIQDCLEHAYLTETSGPC
jgi:RNA polymerase sigma-70 factor (ECF subfamily)